MCLFEVDLHFPGQLYLIRMSGLGCTVSVKWLPKTSEVHLRETHLSPTLFTYLHTYTHAHARDAPQR